jgi:hypothetical protein
MIIRVSAYIYKEDSLHKFVLTNSSTVNCFLIHLQLTNSINKNVITNGKNTRVKEIKQKAENTQMGLMKRCTLVLN